MTNYLKRIFCSPPCALLYCAIVIAILIGIGLGAICGVGILDNKLRFGFARLTDNSESKPTYFDMCLTGATDTITGGVAIGILVFIIIAIIVLIWVTKCWCENESKREKSYELVGNHV